MQYLILGAEGYIGSYLYRRMKEEKLSVIGTGHKNSDLIYFNLLNSSLEDVMELVTDKKKTAIFCIAESNIDRCYINYEEAYRVNVVLTKITIHKLIQNGFHVIFFSSDNVFDGRCGNYTEESRISAINEYGKMKAEMESFLLENEPATCIFRISKVISAQKGQKNMLSQWENGIIQGKISCIRENVLSPVCIEDVYQACIISAMNRMSGLYNIAGDQTYSRKDLVKKFCDMFAGKNVEITECEIVDFGFKDARPLNVSMINHKFKEETGYDFIPVEMVFQQYMKG